MGLSFFSSPVHNIDCIYIGIFVEEDVKAPLLLHENFRHYRLIFYATPVIMMELKLQGNDMSAMYDLYEALEAEMAQAGLTGDFSVSVLSCRFSLEKSWICNENL